MKSKLLTTILSIFFLVTLLIFNVANISALELNPFADKKIYETSLKEDFSDFIKEDFNDKYGVIRLSKTFLWIETDRIAEYSLTENTDQCLINCESKGKAILYTDGKLFEDKYFLNKKGVEVEIDSQYYIKEIETYYEDVPQYKEVCSFVETTSNNTLKEPILKEPISQEVCNQEIVSYDKVEKEREVWNEYNFENLSAGNYEWKIIGKKDKIGAVDWIPTAHGKSLNEWAWWNGDWSKKKEITVLGGDTDLSSFAIFLEVQKESDMKSDYSDLRFLNSTETEEYDYYIESYNSTQANVWVNVPNLETGNNTIYMYYGNNGASSTGSSSNTFTSYTDVYSLFSTTNLKGANSINKVGTLYETNDATFGTATNTNAVNTKTNHYKFNTEFIDDSINPSGTLGFWVKTTTTSNWEIMAKGVPSYTTDYCLVIDSSGNIGDACWSTMSSGIDVADGEWHYITWTWGASDRIYVDGVDRGSMRSPTSKGPATTDYLFTGYHLNDYTTNSTIDNIYFTNSIKSSDWIEREYQNSNSSYSTFGSEESAEGVSVALSSPANAFNSNSQTIFFNATITPTALTIKNVTLYLNGEEYLDLYDTNEIIDYFKTLELEDGSYTWNITACGLGDETICTTSDTRTFSIDSTPPQVEIINPINNTNYDTFILLNISAIDDNLDSIWYNLNDGENITYTEPISIAGLQGINYLNVYANDTLNNINSSNIIYYLEKLSVYLTSPLNDTIIYSNPVTFIANATTLEGTLLNATLYYNDGSGWNTESDYSSGVPDITSLDYTGKNFSIGSQEGTPIGLHFNTDGNKMYILGAGSRVFQYTLSTPWDVLTASYDNKNFSFSGQDSVTYGLFINQDGNKMYINGQANDRVFQYTLSTPWDISTASYDNKNFFLTQIGASVPLGLYFSDLGNKMYVGGYTNNEIYQYTLSTPWDVSTASYETKIATTTTPYGLTFSFEGSSFLYPDRTNDRIYQYNLSTPWDISTAIIYNYSSISSQEGNPSGVYINFIGNFYMVGSDNDRVFQYDIDGSSLSMAYFYESFNPGEIINWNIEFCTTDGSCKFAGDNWTFVMDSIAPQVTASLNETILYSEGQEVGLEYNITDSNLGSCWYTYNDINTSINCSETSTTITTTLSSLDVVVYANDSLGNLNQSETLSMILDPAIPEIILSAGNETSGYYYSGVNHTINFTINDDNLDSIWWEYNSANTSISPAISGEAQSITFEVDSGIYTATIYANDSIGNSNQLIVNWGYGLTEDSITFNPTTIEGSIEDYYLNVTLSGLSLTSAIFYYDGVAKVSQIEADGNERFIKVEDFEVPAVTTDEDKEFYWTLIFSDETAINSTFNNQSVNNIGVNSCGGSYIYSLMNLYLKDEETTDTINGYIEVDYSLFNPTTETTIQNYSYLFEDVNNVLICSDMNLSDSDFLFDTQIRYYATNYSSELYNIQMGSLETPINLSLYYLAIDDSTEFLVTYQDENAIKVEGAIIQLLRKYISEGIYRVVEAPETSADGTAVLHIDLDSVIYDVIVIKDGVELDRFENVVFACDSAYSTLCTQKLYGTLDPGNSIPIETIDDFSYALTTFNDSIKLTYSITSGTPSDINMILEQTDSFGFKINCNESVVSSGGSIECGFNETIGDSVIKVLVLKDGEPMAIKSYVLEEDRRIEFLGNNYFIALIILLSVVAMAFSSPEWIVMNGVFTMLILGGLTLVRGLNFTIGLGSLMWLIVAGAILVMKISKQEDR